MGSQHVSREMTDILPGPFGPARCLKGKREELIAAAADRPTPDVFQEILAPDRRGHTMTSRFQDETNYARVVSRSFPTDKGFSGENASVRRFIGIR